MATDQIQCCAACLGNFHASDCRAKEGRARGASASPTAGKTEAGSTRARFADQRSADGLLVLPSPVASSSCGAAGLIEGLLWPSCSAPAGVGVKLWPWPKNE
jgi:hypothetical protein